MHVHFLILIKNKKQKKPNILVEFVLLNLKFSVWYFCKGFIRQVTVTHMLFVVPVAQS